MSVYRLATKSLALAVALAADLFVPAPTEAGTKTSGLFVQVTATQNQENLPSGHLRG